MKPFPIQEFSAIIEECRARQRAGEDTEAIAGHLQEQGLSPIESMRILMEVQNLSLDEAKQRVHHSKAWSERKDEFESLHDGLEKANP